MVSTSKGAVIFDPFSGSSTTGVVSIKLNRIFIGCELDEKYVNISIKRLNYAINEKENNFLEFNI